MLPRIIVLVLIGLLIYQISLYVKRQPPQLKRQAIAKVILYCVVGLLVLLALAGKLHWIGAAIALMIPFLKFIFGNFLRYFPILASLFPRLKMGPSTFSSQTLQLHIDFKTPAIDGKILQGPLQGKSLSQLTDNDIQQLLDYCQKNDQEALRLVQFYFRKHESSASTFTGSDIDRQQALAILGLSETASERDIIAAHRRLMQKVHPDRGGSDYLAARINLAKDVLLKSKKKNT